MNALPPPDLIDARLRAARLRAPLLAELRRPPEAAALRPAIAAASLALAVALTAFGLSRGPQPALAVEQQDGWLELRVADASASAGTLTRELRAAGIHGEVRLLPVAADRVGRWAITSEHAISKPIPSPDAVAAGRIPPPETVRLSHVDNDGETLRIRISSVRESSGYFIFYAGRKARPGEQSMQDGRLRYAP